MAINPPYRFDPLQNPVDVKGEPEELTGNVEGITTASVRVVWLFSEGVIEVLISDGPGTLRIKVVGSSGPGTDVAGTFSGATGTNGTFVNSGDGIFTPVGGGGLSGTVGAINFAGSDVTTLSAVYNFSSLIFTQTAGGRVFTVSGVTEGSYDYSQALSIPRSVAFTWGIILTAEA